MSNTQVINVASSTPTIPTSFDTFDGATPTGTAVPAANVINIVAEGGLHVSATGNTITIIDSEDSQTGQTIGATNLDLFTYTMPATPTAVTFQGMIVGMNQSGGGGDYGAGYFVTCSAITDGAAASILGTPNIDEFESAALFAGALTVQAIGNNVVFSLLGTAGETIDWRGELNLISQVRTA